MPPVSVPISSDTDQVALDEDVVVVCRQIPTWPSVEEELCDSVKS